jgi:GMP synthase-like glutamine amidotransferase
VNDDLGWIRTALDLARAVVAEERPALGVCFGHQLLAHALGGRVERASGGWGLGARVYETVRPLPWLSSAAPDLTLIASHQDQVVEAPSDAVIWSRAPYCPVAGLAIGERAWTLQAHPEFTPDVSRILLERRRAEVGDRAIEEARATLSLPLSNDEIAGATLRMAGR